MTPRDVSAELAPTLCFAAFSYALFFIGGLL